MGAAAAVPASAADPAGSMVPTAARRTYAETWGTARVNLLSSRVLGLSSRIMGIPGKEGEAMIRMQAMEEVLDTQDPMVTIIRMVAIIRDSHKPHKLRHLILHQIPPDPPATPQKWS